METRDRTTGQTIRPDPVTLEDRVRQWTVVRDCLEGDMRIKQRGTAYLPRPSGMRSIANTQSFTITS